MHILTSSVVFSNNFEIILDFPIVDFVNVRVFFLTNCRLFLFNPVNQLRLLNCTMSLFVHQVFMIPSVYTHVIVMCKFGGKIKFSVFCILYSGIQIQARTTECASNVYLNQYIGHKDQTVRTSYTYIMPITRCDLQKSEKYNIPATEETGRYVCSSRMFKVVVFFRCSNSVSSSSGVYQCSHFFPGSFTSTTKWQSMVIVLFFTFNVVLEMDSKLM